MDSIPVFCHTNLDKFRMVEWPQWMCCRPQIGDYVQGSGGHRLKVVSVTHIVDSNRLPKLRVELHE